MARLRKRGSAGTEAFISEESVPKYQHF
jgi:hypothetical protein